MGRGYTELVPSGHVGQHASVRSMGRTDAPNMELPRARQTVQVPQLQDRPCKWVPKLHTPGVGYVFGHDFL